MVFESFDQLIAAVQRTKSEKRVAVAAAHDKHTLEAVIHASKNRIVQPILIGNGVKIRELLEVLQQEKDSFEIISVQDDAAAAATAVQFIHEGKADFLMKGKLQTADLLRAVVDSEKGLRTGNVISHVAIHEFPRYHKLLAVTDGGMVMYPGQQEKKQIVENSVKLLRGMGYTLPRVGVLAAVEKVNPKMPETLDARWLKEQNQQGALADCIVEGPISYDLVMSKGSAQVKGFESEITGEADILLVPNMTAGNILGKALVYSAGAKMAGLIVGAKVPIVLTSRGASAEEKYLSLVLAASVSQQV